MMSKMCPIKSNAEDLVRCANCEDWIDIDDTDSYVYIPEFEEYYCYCCYNLLFVEDNTE